MTAKQIKFFANQIYSCKMWLKLDTGGSKKMYHVLRK